MKLKSRLDLQTIVGRYYRECNATNPPKIYSAVEMAEICTLAVVDDCQKQVDELVGEILKWVRYEKCKNPEHPACKLKLNFPKSLCHDCLCELEQKYGVK